MDVAANIATKQDIADLKAFFDQRLRELLTDLSRSDNRYMDLEQCAAYIGRTTHALRGLIRRRQIPHMRIGRRLQFDRDKIDSWMKRHARRGALLDHPG